MANNNQGLTLGEQVRNNTVNAQQVGYLNRTSKLVQYQQDLAYFNDLKQQAQDINSKIKSFDDYKTTYAGLTPELRQFFKSPDAVQGEIDTQHKQDITKIESVINDYQKQQADLLQQKQAFMNSTTGQDINSRNAQLREYEVEYNALGKKISALNDNKLKINEGYALNDILDFAERSGQYTITASKPYTPVLTTGDGSIAVTQNPLKEVNKTLDAIKEFEKNNPTEKVVVDANGKIMGVDSGIFKASYNLENYQKAIDKNNALFDQQQADIIKATAGKQSISPLYLAQQGKTPVFNTDQPYVDFVEPRFTEKLANVGGQVATAITGSSNVGKNVESFENAILGTGKAVVRDTVRASVQVFNQMPVLFGTTATLKGGIAGGKTAQISDATLNKIANENDIFAGAIIGSAVLVHASGQPELIIPMDTYFFTQGVEGAVKDIQEGNYGSAVASGLMTIPFLSDLRTSVNMNVADWKAPSGSQTYFGSVVTNFMNDKGGVLGRSTKDIFKEEKPKELPSIVDTNMFTDSADESTISKSKAVAKTDENGNVISKGILFKMKEAENGVSEATKKAIVSSSKQLGDASLGKNGKNLGYDMGVGGSTASISDDIATLKEAKLLGNNNYMLKVVQYTKDLLKIPEIKENYWIIKQVPNDLLKEDLRDITDSAKKIKTMADWTKEGIEQPEKPKVTSYGVIVGKGDLFEIPSKDMKIKPTNPPLFRDKIISDEINDASKSYNVKKVQLDALANFINSNGKIVEDSLKEDIQNIFERNKPIPAEISREVSKKARIDVRNIHGRGVVQVITKDIKDIIKNMATDNNELSFTRGGKSGEMTADEIEKMLVNGHMKSFASKEPLGMTAEDWIRNDKNVKAIEKYFKDLSKEEFKKLAETGKKVYPKETVVSDEIKIINKEILKEKINQKNMNSAIAGIPVIETSMSNYAGTGVYERYSFSENLLPKVLVKLEQPVVWNDNGFMNMNKGGNKFSGTNPEGKFGNLNGGGKFGNLGVSGRMPTMDFEGDAKANNKLIDDIMSKFNSGIKDNSNSGAKSNARQQEDLNAVLKGLMGNGVKSGDNSRINDRLDLADSLKFDQSLKLVTEFKFDQGNDFEFETDLNDINDFDSMGFEWGTGLKNKVKKKTKKKLKGINEMALFPDFTAKALGLEPQKIKLKDLNKVLKGASFNFGISKGGTLI